VTILARLEDWRQRGVISPEQQAFLAGLSRNEPYSLFLELNVLLYAGVAAFIAGLGWTITTWSQQLGDIAILTVLSALLAVCFGYCFSRAPVWSPKQTPSPNLGFDYVLYLGCLVVSLEFGYIETRFHALSGQWENYLLICAVLFFFFAYRFDNRFVLSLALSSLAGWFGISISHRSQIDDAVYRQSAIVYSLTVAIAGAISAHTRLKPHFLGAYLNIGANVLFWALLSGVFLRERYAVWFLALLLACGASLAWGIARREFSFVAYAAVYGYIGFSSIMIRNMSGDATILSYFVITGAAMLMTLILIARRFSRE
jgi:hypothetical protein